MHKKTIARIRRAGRTRAKIRESGLNRLTVHKTPRHIYAQIIGPGADMTLVAAATTEKALAEDLPHTGNIEAAKRIGATLAQRAKTLGLAKVAFDRSGYKYHGRVRALADAARENGLEF